MIDAFSHRPGNEAHGRSAERGRLRNKNSRGCWISRVWTPSGQREAPPCPCCRRGNQGSSYNSGLVIGTKRVGLLVLCVSFRSGLVLCRAVKTPLSQTWKSFYKLQQLRKKGKLRFLCVVFLLKTCDLSVVMIIFIGIHNQGNIVIEENDLMELFRRLRFQLEQKIGRNIYNR